MRNDISHFLSRGGALLAAAVLLAACGREVRVEEAPDASLFTLPAAASEVLLPTSAPISISTLLYSENDAELSARVRSVVKSVEVELGDRVEAGQLLARLDDGEARAAVAVAEAAAGLARADYERAVALGEKNVITQAELDQALFRIRTEEAALEWARVHLEYTQIRAPFDGVVSRRHVRLGQPVAEGQPLFRVTGLRPLRAQVQIPEERIDGLSRGDRVVLRGSDGVAVNGRIFRISPAVDPASGTVEVLVDIPDPGRLRPGTSAVVELPTRPAATAASSDG
jgi:membrane fusion protein, multidrug efflux system